MAELDFPITTPWLQSLIDACYLVGSQHPARQFPTEAGDIFSGLFIAAGSNFSIRLHEWVKNDPRELHDHRYDCVTIVLDGGVWEVTPQGRFWRAPGDVIFRRAEEPHRIEIDPEHPLPRTLFLTGAPRRQMGFHTSSGWVAADAFLGRK